MDEQVTKPKIVIFGGGTGLSVLLRGLKHYPVDITAIVTVADDGGSSGILRDEFKVPPPGDVRNVLAALSDVEPLIEQLFQHRFNTSSTLSGHPLGNLILAGLTSITGDFAHAIQAMSKVLNVRGRVLPAANRGVTLKAEMEDGTIIKGESKIPYSGKRIEKVFISPKNVEPLKETIEVIREADLLVLGPGSLFTSVLPNLLVKKIGREVCAAKAKKVYVCNVMTQPGETLHFSASDHVKAIYDHMACAFIDTVVVNDAEIPAPMVEKYAAEFAEPVVLDRAELETLGLQVISGDLVQYQDDVIRHNTVNLAKILYDLVVESVEERVFIMSREQK